MSNYEKEIEKRFTEAGLEFQRGGWPDYLVYKQDTNKEITDFFFVEAKGKGDDLSPNQKKNHRLLELLGLPVFVDWEEFSPKEYWKKAQKRHRDKIKKELSPTARKFADELKTRKEAEKKKEENNLLEKIKSRHTAAQAILSQTKPVADLNSSFFKNDSEKTKTLTPREIQICALAVSGLLNREIAQEFSIAKQTVKNHLHSIFVKMGVKNRLEMVLVLSKEGLDKAPIT